MVSSSLLGKGIYLTARDLGMDPVTLATIISYETGGTFDPTKKGPTTKWGQHQGFIQFGEPQAKQHGVDWTNPVSSQLGRDKAISKYFKSSGWKPGMSEMDAYSIVNAGGPGRYGASDTAAGGAPGTVSDKVTQQFGPHREKAMAMFGMNPLSVSTRSGSPFVPPAPNQVAPERQGVIQQLMGGMIGKVGTPFNPDGTGGPLQQMESGATAAERMYQAAALSRDKIANSNAPASWMQVLGSVGNEVGGAISERRAEKASAERTQQITDLMASGDLTPETIAQIAALDPALGQELMTGQISHGQDLERDELNYARDLELAQIEFDNEIALEQMKPEDRTALMKEVEAAGFVPGTPEYHDYIRKRLEDAKGGTQLVIGADGQVTLATGGASLPGGTTSTPQVGAANLDLSDVAGPGQVDPNAPPGVDTTIADPNAAPQVVGPVISVADPPEGSMQAIPPGQGLQEMDIPGGAADQSKSAKAGTTQQTAGVVLGAIDRAMELSMAPGATGGSRILTDALGAIIPGGGPGPLQGSSAASLDAQLDIINSNEGFDRLQAMRDASPTGGALGQVTERELDLLQSTRAALRGGLKGEELQKELVKLKGIIERNPFIAAVISGADPESVKHLIPKTDPSTLQERGAAGGAKTYEVGKIYKDKNGNRARRTETGWETP